VEETEKHTKKYGEEEMAGLRSSVYTRAKERVLELNFVVTAPCKKSVQGLKESVIAVIR
jgi:hypothetical protein